MVLKMSSDGEMIVRRQERLRCEVYASRQSRFHVPEAATTLTLYSEVEGRTVGHNIQVSEI